MIINIYAFSIYFSDEDTITSINNKFMIIRVLKIDLLKYNSQSKCKYLLSNHSYKVFFLESSFISFYSLITFPTPVLFLNVIKSYNSIYQMLLQRQTIPFPVKGIRKRKLLSLDHNPWHEGKLRRTLEKVKEKNIKLTKSRKYTT